MRNRFKNDSKNDQKLSLFIASGFPVRRAGREKSQKLRKLPAKIENRRYNYPLTAPHRCQDNQSEGVENMKRICLVVLPHIGESLQSFYYKNAFIDHVKSQHNRIAGDDALVIFSGGSHATLKINDIKNMPWILESA